MATVRFGAANHIGQSPYAGMSDTDSGLTAFSGGGQSSAVALTAQSNYITTVAAGNDSVALPKIVLTPGQFGSVGTMVFVANAGANTLKVYGKTPDTINASATGTGVTVATGVNVWFVAVSYDRATGIGLWRMTNSQAASVAAITSGTITGVTIDNSVIGGSTPAAGTFTSIVANDITGGDSSLGIAGLAATQGGAVALVGGASSTSGNAGGAVTMVGGAPGATGIGGAVTATGAAGGASSGAGGAVTFTGGAGTAGNAAGGAASLIGGLGQGSQAGGAITITSGAAGATGVAGAVNISVGAATAGNGSSVTITGGAGAGGTASGGNVNLVPGAAVSTGAPGEVLVASVAGLFDATWQQYLPASVPVSGSSYTFFMANRAYRVKAASCSCSSTATVPTVDVIKDTGTTAPGGGTSVLTGVMTFDTTANTRVVGTVSSTIATVTLAAGNRLSTKWAGTVGSITGAIVSVTLVPA